VLDGPFIVHHRCRIQAQPASPKQNRDVIGTVCDLEYDRPAISRAHQISETGELLTLGYFKGVYSVEAQSYAASTTLSMHVPVIHRETVPVFFQLLETTPPGKVTEYHTAYKGGDNWIAEVTFENMNPGDSIVIPWECWTLKKNQDFLDMPSFVDTLSLATLHDSLDCYLTASAYIQSDHPDIIAKAEEIFGDGNNVVRFVQDVIDFAGDTLPYEPYGAQDALTTLQRGYAVCTGKANLAVALLRYHEIETVDVPVPQSIEPPLGYTLYQNHPNPFNSTTVIRYSVPERSVVRLKIYSLLGREVEVLELGPVEKGEYDVHWNASGLPGGIYLCRLTVNGYSESKKLILLN
jgi:hypothetical protein